MFCCGKGIYWKGIEPSWLGKLVRLHIGATVQAAAKQQGEMHVQHFRNALAGDRVITTCLSLKVTYVII